MKKITASLKEKKWALRLSWARLFYGNPSRKMKIVGVTGTSGKTTTATLLYKLAVALGHKAGFIGTTNILINNNEYKVSGRVPSTTPDSVTLTKVFSKMAKAKCEYVFMEVSSHALEQKRVSGVNFIGGIFTNLSHDHLDYHKSMESYFRAKKKFFEMLPTSAFALANIDDEHGAEMLAGISANKYTYGFLQPADFQGKILKTDFSGVQIKVKEEDLKSKLIGRFNAYNLLAVWSTSELLNFPKEKVKKILEDIEPPPGRFDYFISKNGVLVIVDYAHKPDALEKVLNTIKEIKSKDGRIISLVGCGGDRDPLKRRVMGKLNVTLSDIPILTSDNPRSEDPDKILAEMKVDLSMPELKRTLVISSRREAIEKAAEIAKKGDIILCAGKGHETYQEIRGVKHHFNDLEEFKRVFS